MTGLADIETLAERVVSQSAKSSVREAIKCYNAGAYRSCIVTTWIAIIHDFLDKFRDLAIAGDAEAIAQVKEFDRIQTCRDIPAALKFEREVLDKAAGEFELISPQERIDLARIFEDRNRFSHPNLNQDAEVLTATAEQARSHLRNAIEHVLGRSVVQGKAAIGSIQATIDSPLFPTSVGDAETVLIASPLSRAKRSVVREIFLGCITSLVRERLDARTFGRRLAASEACRRIHRECTNDLIDSKLSAIFDATPDNCMAWLIVLISREADYRSKVSVSCQIRLTNYIQQVSGEEFTVLHAAGNIPWLASVVEQRLSVVTVPEMQQLLQRFEGQVSPTVVDAGLALLEKATSWNNANAISDLLLELVPRYVSESQAMRIVRAGRNPEVQSSFGYPNVVKKLLESGLLTKETLQEAVTELKISGLSSLLN